MKLCSGSSAGLGLCRAFGHLFSAPAVPRTSCAGVELRSLFQQFKGQESKLRIVLGTRPSVQVQVGSAVVGLVYEAAPPQAPWESGDAESSGFNTPLCWRRPGAVLRRYKMRFPPPFQRLSRWPQSSISLGDAGPHSRRPRGAEQSGPV